MSRAKRGRINERFAMVPVSVMLSPAYKSLRAVHRSVLWTLAALYTGRNNGDLALTRSIAKHFGLNNEAARSHGLSEAEDCGLIVKAHQGGKKPMKPTLWALTWRPIDHWEGRKLDVVRLPPHTWQSFGKNKTTATKAEPPSATKVVVDPLNISYEGRSSSSPKSTTNVVAPSENLGEVSL